MFLVQLRSGYPNLIGNFQMLLGRHAYFLELR
jgi:hypothetical protein